MKNWISKQLEKRPCAIPVLLRSGEVDFIVSGLHAPYLVKSEITLDSYQDDLYFTSSMIPEDKDIMKTYPIVKFSEGSRANWIRQENKAYVDAFFKTIEARKAAAEAEKELAEFSKEEVQQEQESLPDEEVTDIGTIVLDSLM